MLEGLAGYLKKKAPGFLLGSGLLTIVGVALHGSWKEDQAHTAFIDKIERSDVTAWVCPSDKPATSLTRTLVPLLGIEDSTTQKSGKELLQHATKDGVTFAFCTLAEGTTSFEPGVDTETKVFPVLKINDDATAQEQQAAILQFLKEYQGVRVSTRYNAVVKADADLTRIMPGRVPFETDVHDYRVESSPTLNIPSR